MGQYDAEFDSFYDSAAKAQLVGGGTWFEYGTYVAVITNVMLQKGYKDMSYIAEFRVLGSAQLDPAVTPARPGSTRSLVCKPNSDMGLPNWVTFITAALKCRGFTGEMTKDVMASVAVRSVNRPGEKYFDQAHPNPLRGVIIANEMYEKTGTKTDRDRVLRLNKWVPVPQTKGQIEKVRAILDDSNFDLLGQFVPAGFKGNTVVEASEPAIAKSVKSAIDIYGDE